MDSRASQAAKKGTDAAVTEQFPPSALFEKQGSMLLISRSYEKLAKKFKK